MPGAGTRGRGRPPGLALAALLYLGKSEVTHEVIAQIQHALLPGEFEVLLAANVEMPAWLNEALRPKALANDHTH